MASQSTTNASPVRGSSSVSSSPSSPSSPQQPLSSSAIPTPTSVSPSSLSHQNQAQSVSTSTSVSLSSTSQVAGASIASPSSSQPSVVDNSGIAEADRGPVPLKIIIPVTAVIASSFLLLLLLYSYRRYQRRQQLKETPLPAKRTPVILERRRTQFMDRFKVAQTSNNSPMAPITSPPRNLGTSSYLPFPSKDSNISDGSYTHPSLTLSASVLALSLEGQPSVSPSTPSHELAKDTSASALHSLTGDYPIGPLQFLQQPFTPPYARRDPRPAHSRAVSIVSVASRHSNHSLAAMRSGQHTGSGTTLRGAPHKNNVNIVLPQPLGHKGPSVSTYNVQYEEPPSVHPQNMDSMGGIYPPAWNEHGELRHRSNASKDGMREGWEERNPGSYQTSSLAAMSYAGISHSQSAPAVVDWPHKGSPLPGPPDYNVNMAMNALPVPPLPQHLQIPGAESRASGTSSPASLVSHAPPLLPGSVFTDADWELESTTVKSEQTTASFTYPHPPPTLPTNAMGNGRMDTIDAVWRAASPAAP